MARRILLLTTDLEIGGTPTVVRELALRLNGPDAVVEVACLAGPGPVADQLARAGIATFPLRAKRVTDIGVVRRLVRLIRQRNYDTVFSFLVHANAVAAAAALFCREVRFLQSIQTTQRNPRWHWRVQSVASLAADRIVVPSESIARVAREWAKVPRSKLVVVPNAIEPEDFAPGARDPDAIGFIGRLDPIKRIPDLIRAMLLVDAPVHLHLFGEGSERPHLEALIRELGLSRRVTLHGAVARPQDALANISLLVLPSEAEGFGLVLIEAMAASVPVVATNVAGIRDVVRNELTGLLVPPFSPRELAGAIRRISADPEFRRMLVARAKRDVTDRFTWNAVLPVYRDLLKIGPHLSAENAADTLPFHPPRKTTP